MNKYIENYRNNILNITQPKSPSIIFSGNNLKHNEILDICDKLINITYNKHISKNVYHDLNIFGDNSIFSKIDRTNSFLGSHYLKKILYDPIDNINLLQKRQDIIKKINNIDTVNIRKIIKELSILEPHVLWLWKDINSETKYLLDSVYFTNSYLQRYNTNSLIMNITSMFKIVIAPIYGILQPVFLIIMPYLYIKFFSGVRISFSAYFRLVKFSFFNVNPINPLGNPNSSRSKLSKTISTCISIMFYIQGIYNSIESSKFTNNIITQMHTLVNSISKYISLTQELNNIISKIIETNILPKIFENLNNKIFKTEPHILSNKGLILTEFKNLLDNKDQLKSYLEFNSYIDTLLSISSLQDENYTWTKFIKNKNPSINIKEVWNPIIGFDKSIKNDIQIGNNNPRNVLLTGPNAGGKTTFIKSICLQVLLSQTITLSSSFDLKITPFSLISSHINISDTLGKDSLFEAEMSRAKSHISNISNLNKLSFSFIIMDEIFSSTNPEEGMSGGYAIGEKIGKYNNSISMITTHYNYLTKLEKTGLFKNYKIVVEKENNKIKYPYKIEDGASKQHIALELLYNKGFDKEIINRAIDIRSDIVSKQYTKLKKKN